MSARQAFRSLMAVLCGGVLFVGTTSAKTIYVSLNSAVNGPGTSLTNAYQTLQEGVDAAADGDLVLVDNGVYNTGGKPAEDCVLTNRVCIDKSIVVKSINGRDSVVIQGAAGGTAGFGHDAVRCVMITANGVLDGFTLYGGYTDLSTETDPDNMTNITDVVGGGAFLYGAGSAISNCAVRGCHAYFAGGGVMSFQNSTVANCLVQSNSAPNGAGVYLHNGSGVTNAFVNIVAGCGVYNNLALSGPAMDNSGGGIYGETGSLISNSAVSTNRAGNGGGIYLDGGGVVTNCLIAVNTVTNNGGGILFDSGGGLYSSRLIGNSATNDGGGSFCDDISGTILNCDITANNARRKGGGSFGGYISNCGYTNNICGVSGGAANWATIADSYFYGNIAQKGGGTFECDVRGCTYADNSADDGGGNYNGSVGNSLFKNNYANNGGGGTYYGAITNCMIMTNSAGTYGGGAYGGMLGSCLLSGNSAYYGGGGYQSTMKNCTVVKNKAYMAGGAYYCSFDNSIVWYNAATNGDDNVLGGVPAYSCAPVAEITNSVGCITNRPMFVDSASGNWHLQAASPCRNTGDDTKVQDNSDLDGNPRIIKPAVDMGAYEYISSTNDFDGDGLSNDDEGLCHTDPTDPQSVFEVSRMATSNNVVIIKWPSAAGELYTVQSTVDLSAGFTNNVQQHIAGTPPQNSFAITNAAANLRFYRVILEK